MTEMAKNIVITGGTKGIGRAILEQFAKKGFNIFVCSRTDKELQEVKNNIESKYNVVCNTFQGDMSQKSEVLKFSKVVLEKFKTVDVLINNVGYFVPGEICEEEDGKLEEMMNANVYSAYHLTRSLINPIIKSKGYIFNICSIASIIAYPNGGSYSITKFALYGMTKVLREELKTKDVRVTAVLPGAVLTASWDGVDLPAERFIKPLDVALSIENAYDLSPNSVIEELIIRPQLGDI